MAKIGIRYAVTYVPTTIAEKRAKAKGRKPNDGTSLWDWIEESDVTISHFHAEQGAALKTAKRLLPADVFGAIRVIEQKSCRCAGFPQRQWADVRFWEVRADTTKLGEPDHVFADDDCEAA